MRGGRAAELVAVLILALGTWLGFATSGLPSVVPATAPATAFSAERAMHDLQVISTAPHATGSTEHDKVRDYIVDRLRALGADEVHVQYATGFNTLQGPLAATVANVVARKHGSHGGPAVLLSAHYDAVPRSFGAGDDGAGVAAILETVRALASGAPLERDLIITIVDAEEDGLLGAEAFVNLHPWAKDAGVVLNFDGRGNAGPVYMFQTTPGNTPLINALAKVAGARTNSLTGEVYRHLPSDTDLSIWLHSGFAGGALNFAHVGGYQNYHTPMDNVASLDPRVLQQMGDYALSLTRTFGGTGLTALRTTDAIYFSAPFVGVIHYPASWAMILSIDAMALVLVLIGLGWYRRTLSLRGVGRGALALAITLALPTLVTFAAWRLIAALHPAYREILQGDPYNSLWYLLAAGSFAVAAVVTIQLRFDGRRAASHATVMELAIAPMVLWGIIGLVVALTLPGASYLFAWPLFAATVCASWWRRETIRQRVPPAALALFAIPALVLWPPLVESLEIALTADMLPLCTLLAALMLSVIMMPLQLAGEARRWIVTAASVIALGALIRAEVGANFTAERKRPDSLSYLVDTDSAKAWWATFDRATDSWTRTTLGASPQRRPFTSFGMGTLLATESTRPAIGDSPVRVISNVETAGSRRVHLLVARSGVGETVSLDTDTAAVVSEVTINGRLLADGNDDRYRPHYHMGSAGKVLRYFGVPEEGIDVWFSVKSHGPLTVRVIAGVEGFAAAAPGARPSEYMSKPFVATDMTLTLWRVKL